MLDKRAENDEINHGSYVEFMRGGRKFYRYGTWEIEADLARKTRPSEPPLSGANEGNPDPNWVPEEIEDEYNTELELQRIARERSNSSASAAALGLTTGGQTGYLGGNVARRGKTQSAGGGYASKILAPGRNAARLLGGY